MENEMSPAIEALLGLIPALMVVGFIVLIFVSIFNIQIAGEDKESKEPKIQSDQLSGKELTTLLNANRKSDSKRESN